MKVWLDDIRNAPKGWNHYFWPEDVYPLLANNLISEISLDHDLGNDSRGTGYDILNYIEKNLVENNIQPPKIYVHTQNPVAKQRMLLTIKSIIKLALLTNRID